jgi:bifunctional ADP-heptose synthase (sugar kinase/adenylyltransferase)
VAAGIVVGKRGTASVTIQEIQERLKELRGVAPESRAEGAQHDLDLKPMELGAEPERPETGIGAND